MRAKASTRSLLLTVACLSALQAGCTSSGGMIGIAPEGTTSTAQTSSSADDETGSTADAVESGDFRPLINKGGVQACMDIKEEDVPTNYWETVAWGAAAGTVVLAVLGAAAGAILTGGHGDGAAAGAAAGAALGLGFGTVDGAQTAEQKTQYALNIARYDCQTQAAEMENATLKGSGDRLQASVAGLNRQLDQLEDDYANKRLTRAQAQKELNDIDDASASLQHRLVAMKENTGKYQQYASSTEGMAMATQMALDEARLGSLDRQIAEMETRNTELEQDYQELVDRRKALLLQ